MKKIFVLVFFIVGLFSCKVDVVQLEKIEFNISNLTLELGSSSSVDIKYYPADAENVNVEYSCTQSGIVEITDKSNYGCAIKAISPGSTILVASSNEVKAYLEIKVEDNNVYFEPVIILPYVTLEMKIGEKKNIIATLYGGTAQDNTNFTFESDDDCIKIDGVGNNCIVTAVKSGVSRITAKHPKSSISSSFLVYVANNEEKLFYLTTKENCIKTYLEDNNDVELKIDIVGGDDSEKPYINFNVVEGTENISIVSNNGNCSIISKKMGNSVIEVSHYKSKKNLYIDVLVSSKTKINHIEVDNDFIVIDGKNTVDINASFIGEEFSDVNSKYSFEIENEGIIDVVQSFNTFHIKGLKDGKSKLIISNEYTEYKKEVLVVVENTNLKSTINYISVDKTYIKMEMGDKNIPVNVKLTGGNESDKNNFIYKVKNKNVVDLLVADGKVEYGSVQSRAIVQAADVYETSFYLNAIGLGETEIEITHPKTNISARIIINVYPKGTLINTNKYISGSNYIKLLKGDSYTYLLEKRGIEENLDVIWESESDIIELTESNFSCVINAKESGTTSVKVYGDKITNIHTFIVIVCETEEELESVNAIYSSEKFIDVGVGQNKYLSLNTLLESDGEFTCTVEDSQVCYARVSQDVLVIEGLTEGSTQIKVNHSKIPGEIIFYINVFNSEISYNYPYQIKSDNFISVLINKSLFIDVNLIGASDEQYNNIGVVSSEGKVRASIENKKLKIEGIESGEDIITLYHPKSKNQKNIYVYIASTQEELDSKVILYSEKMNYLIKNGEKLFITIDCNKESELENLVWKVSDTSIVEIDVDKNTALITGLNEGCTQISVSHASGSNFNFYVSVSEDYNIKEPQIKLPSIIELVIGDSRSIEIENDIYVGDDSVFNWEIEDSSVAKIYSNDRQCKVEGLSSGETNLIVSNSYIGYKRVISIIVRNNIIDFEGVYAMAIDNTVNNIEVGEYKSIKINFGTYKLPELMYEDFEVVVSDSNIVDVSINSNNIELYGKNEGRSEVIIRNKNCVNEIKFIVNVFDKESNSNYSVLVNKNLTMIKGSTEDLLFTIVNNLTNEEIDDYSSIELEYDEQNLDVNYGAGLLRIKAIECGVYKIKLKSNLFSFSKEILVYVVNSEDEKNNSLIFSLDKSYYLIKCNESLSFELDLSDDTSSLINEIEYLYDSSIIDLNLENKTKFHITGKKEGTTDLKIRCRNFEYKVVVSVLEYDYTADERIYCEDIINVIIGESYESILIGDNLSLSDDESDIIDYGFTEKNNLIVKGNVVGTDEITIYNGTEKKVIVVNVVSNKEELYQIKSLNISNRIHVVEKGNTILLKPTMYPNFSDINNINYTLVYDSNIIEISVNSNNMLVVKGLNEGLEKIRVECSGYNSIELDILVKEGSIQKVDEIEQEYLTTDQNVYYIEYGDKELLRTYIYGTGNIEDDDEFIWECSDDSLLNVYYQDNLCYIEAIKATGKCFITVKNKKCYNTVTFQIIVGKHYINNGNTFKYVEVSNNSVSLTYGQKSESVELTLHNIDEEKLSNIVLNDLGKNIIEYNVNINNGKYIVNLKPIICGSGRIEVSHPEADFVTYIDYVVNDDISSNLIYLTTSDNNSIIRVGEYKQIKATLVNFEEKDANSFRWVNESDDKCVMILGEGNVVNLYGIKEGENKIVLYHPLSKNNLEFTVRVSNLDEKYQYITSNANIIETKVSSVMDSFSVNIVGSIDSTLINGLKYSVEDSNILSVVGNNDTCFYRGLKSGITKIIVSHVNNDIIPFEVTVIVENFVEGESYLSCNDILNYLSPFGENKRVSVNVENISNFDKNKFSFYIYSQQLANDSEGSVINLISNENIAVISPQNEGIAKIRCVYTPLNLKLNIMVYVSQVGKVSFRESGITIVSGESQFTSVDVPAFTSDISSFISYSSDNPDVCTIYGTNKVACIEGKSKGITVVRIKNSYDNSEDELVVEVLDQNDINSTRISVSQSYFLLNPRSEKEKINAYLLGNNIIEDDMSNIKWSIEGNSSVKIYPTQGAETTLSLVRNNEGKIEQGDAIITLTHEKCNQDYKKTIYISVEEIQDFFTLSKSSITIDSNTTTEISAKVIGGSSSELEKIQWNIDKRLESDGTYTEVARLLNTTGGKCTILGIEEGTVILTAFYDGVIKQCEIIVKGDRYFSLVSNSLIMYPGQEYDLQYNIRPSTYIPTWFSTDEYLDTRLLQYSVDTVNKIVKLKALKEGSVQLNGMVAGIGTVVCNITIKEDPKLQDISRTYGRINIPLYDKSDSNYNGNIKEVEFFSYPSEYYCDVQIRSRLEDAIEVEVIENHNKPEYDENAGFGKLKIKVLKELPRDETVITLVQYKDQNKTNPTGQILEYTVNGTYNDMGFELYFVRHDGDMTLTNEDENFEILYDSNGNKIFDSSNKALVGKKIIDSDNIQKNSTTGHFIGKDMSFGESESHYLIFKPTHEGQYFNNLKIEVRGGPVITADSIAKREWESSDIKLSVSEFHQEKGNYVSVVDTGTNCDVGIQVDHDPGTNSITVPSTTNERFYNRYRVKEGTLRLKTSNSSSYDLPFGFWKNGWIIDAKSATFKSGSAVWSNIALVATHPIFCNKSSNQDYIVLAFQDIEAHGDTGERRVDSNVCTQELVDFLKDYPSGSIDFRILRYNNDPYERKAVNPYSKGSVVGGSGDLNISRTYTVQKPNYTFDTQKGTYVPDGTYSEDHVNYSCYLLKDFVYNTYDYDSEDITEFNHSVSTTMVSSWSNVEKYPFTVNFTLNMWQPKSVIENGYGESLPCIKYDIIRTILYNIIISFESLDGVSYVYNIKSDLNIYNRYKYKDNTYRGISKFNKYYYTDTLFSYTQNPKGYSGVSTQ